IKTTKITMNAIRTLGKLFLPLDDCKKFSSAVPVAVNVVVAVGCDVEVVAISCGGSSGCISDALCLTAKL
ncbi:hypothetical protein HDU92_006823, partial [Lobulomyces angularis]